MPQKVAEGKCLLSQDFKDKSECATKRIEKAFQAQGAAYLKARRETPRRLAVVSTQGEKRS